MCTLRYILLAANTVPMVLPLITNDLSIFIHVISLINRHLILIYRQVAIVNFCSSKLLSYLATMSITQKFMLITSFMLTQSCISQPIDYESDKVLIKQVLDLQLTAWNKGDKQAFMQGYWNSEQLRFSSKGGTQYGWNNVLDMYNRSFPNREAMGTLHFKLDTIYTNRYPIIQVNGIFTLNRTDTLSGPFSLFFEKIEEQWKITEDHTW